MTAMNHDPLNKLPKERIAIVGVGGTGSHVLDYLSKTPVGEIHLFDKDVFTSESAKRSPGTFDDLGSDNPTKSLIHRTRYSDVHPRIVDMNAYVDKSNVSLLANYTTVFLCIDGGGIKRQILEVCIANQIALINVGMGVFETPNSRLEGMLAVTACVPSTYDHADKCFELDDPSEGDRQNEQTIELNALNAGLAVIKWKKLLGIYEDDSKELDCVYSIAANDICNKYKRKS